MYKIINWTVKLKIKNNNSNYIIQVLLLGRNSNSLYTFYIMYTYL